MGQALDHSVSLEVGTRREGATGPLVDRLLWEWRGDAPHPEARARQASSLKPWALWGAVASGWGLPGQPLGTRSSTPGWHPKGA